MQAIRLNGMEEFEQVSSLWNQLWSRSNCQNPNLKSDALGAACKALYDGNAHFIILLDADEIVAGIPFVNRNPQGLISTIQLPNNQWGFWGDILIDSRFSSIKLVRRLADAVHNLNPETIQLTLIQNQSDEWQQFLNQLVQHGRTQFESPAFEVGLVSLDHDWSDFKSSLSKSFRKKLKRKRKFLQTHGAVKFYHHRIDNQADAERLFKSAFSIEQRSWKANQKSTIFDSQMDTFYREQARLLARSQSLAISLLTVNECPIAFEFGALAKQTYYSWKVGFDQAYSKFSPGQLLMESLTEHLCQVESCQQIDTVGPLSEATSKWTDHNRQLATVTVSGSNHLSLMALSTIHWLKRVKRKSRKI
ncbi:MAG: GNAT family N-acetyltransferase, partial [Planctomycetota bacterium]